MCFGSSPKFTVPEPESVAVTVAEWLFLLCSMYLAVTDPKLKHSESHVIVAHLAATVTTSLLLA